MALVIDCGDLRWAEEPSGPDTIAHFKPIHAAPKRQLRAGVWASLWKLKGK